MTGPITYLWSSNAQSSTKELYNDAHDHTPLSFNHAFPLLSLAHSYGEYGIDFSVAAVWAGMRQQTAYYFRGVGACYYPVPIDLGMLRSVWNLTKIKYDVRSFD